jgi:hypothetical protein
VAHALIGAALAATLAAGCGRPPDEAWLRFLGFRATEGSATLTVVNGTLDTTTDNVDAAFENATFTVGRGDDSGTGILVTSARVEYTMQGYAAPTYEYPVTLYLAAPAKAGETTTGTLSGLPIVPASLKEWIKGLPAPPLSFTARVTFRAESDNGTDLETTGSISIVLTNP